MNFVSNCFMMESPSYVHDSDDDRDPASTDDAMDAANNDNDNEDAENANMETRENCLKRSAGD